MSTLDESKAKSIQTFEPNPGAVYSIEVVADLVAMPRRMILHYCKHGLVSPIEDPTEHGYFFDDEAIRLLRRIEYLRNLCGDNLNGVRLIMELSRQVEQLQTEIRFLRR